MERKAGSETSRNVARIMAIVDALAAAADEGLRLTDVMHAARLNKTTTHRLLTGLVAHGLADHDAHTRRYFVGIRVLSLAQAAKRRFRLASLVEPILVRLSRQTQDTVTIVARQGDEAVCLGCREGSFPIKVLTLHEGDRRPLGIGAGSLALLAFLPDADVERILAEYSRERAAFPFDDVQLRNMITAARRQGYAYNDIHVFKGMETITDMAAVGVPILSSRGTPVAALHLTAITQRLAQPRRDNILAVLRNEVDAIQSAYGPILEAMEPTPAGVPIVTPPAPRQRGDRGLGNRPIKRSPPQ
jgi:DNA-binding IclR family transcriptional regulator